MKFDYEDALDYSSRWLDLIHKTDFPSIQEAHEIIDESKLNFAEHYNRNWLEYRKSVTESGDWAAVEWTGSGSVFKDVLGREYLDFLGGYGMMDLGWSHPDVVSAVRAQLNRSPMPSQELIDPLRGVLAKLLAGITPGDLKYSWFAASGAEANEAAMKIAKLFTGKTAFIVGVKAFHGKTMGALSLMGKADYRAPMGALYAGQVYHVPFGDAGAVENQLEICEKVGVGVAAVMFEPIQGESGAIVPPDDFWPRIRQATKKYGVLLIADEVQTGLGRTGKLWGVEHWNVTPDILTVAKSLGG
jgi:putrescine aminotransferase